MAEAHRRSRKHAGNATKGGNGSQRGNATPTDGDGTQLGLWVIAGVDTHACAHVARRDRPDRP